MRRVSAADDFTFYKLASAFIEVDRLAFVERKQKKLGDRIGTVVLLEHLQRMFTSRVAQNDGVRLEMHGDVVHVDLIFTRLEIEGKILANHCEILVIDGK